MAEKEKLPMGIEDFEEMRKCTLFDGLEISTETELCGRYMGKFPVICGQGRLESEVQCRIGRRVL